MKNLLAAALVAGLSLPATQIAAQPVDRFPHVDGRPGPNLAHPGRDWRADLPRTRGVHVGTRIAPARRAYVAPARYGLAPLPRGRRYAMIGREIYVIDEATGAVLALAALIAATR